MPITFGSSGRYFVKSKYINKGWGKTIALNLLYDPSGNLKDTNAVKKSNRLQIYTGIRKNSSANRNVDYQSLGLIEENDFLNSVSVKPAREFDCIIEGADYIKIRTTTDLFNLESICKNLLKINKEKYYTKDFSHIDKFSIVKSKALQRIIWSQVCHKIVNNNIDDLSMNIDDFDENNVINIKLIGSGTKFRTNSYLNMDCLNTEDYRKKLEKLKTLHQLNFDNLNKQYFHIDLSDGQLIKQKVIKTIEGLIYFSDNTFAIFQGSIYKVDDSYISQLDSFVDDILVNRVVDKRLFPDFMTVPKRSYTKSDGSVENIRDEFAYNQKISVDDDSLLLDRNLIKISKSVTQIELCDVLLSEGIFIHFKRGKDSSSLSHLIAQANVSGELLCDNKEFRVKAIEKINEILKDNPSKKSEFKDLIPIDLKNGSQYTVVFGVIGKVKDKKTGSLKKSSEIIPFFSKINLRNAVKNLSIRSYKIELAFIEE